MMPSLHAAEQQYSAVDARQQIPAPQFHAALLGGADLVMQPPRPPRQSSIPPRKCAPNESKMDLDSLQLVDGQKQKQKQRQQQQALVGTAVGGKEAGAVSLAGSTCTQKSDSACSQPTSGSVAKDDAAPAKLDLDALVASFMHDSASNSLELPLGLHAEQRRRLKAMVEQHAGLRCESFGFGAERRMHIFKECATGHELTGPVALQGLEHGAGCGANFEEFTFGSADLSSCREAIDLATTAGSCQVP